MEGQSQSKILGWEGVGILEHAECKGEEKAG